MSTHSAPLTATQKVLLETVYDTFEGSSAWPKYSYVAAILDGRTNEDLADVLVGMPEGLLEHSESRGVNPIQS